MNLVFYFYVSCFLYNAYEKNKQIHQTVSCLCISEEIIFR